MLQDHQLNCRWNCAYYFKETSCTRAIPKSTSDWLVKRIQNTEQNFIIWNRYIHICITSPHSCHPHLGTCHTVALAFAVPCQRMVPPSYAARF